MPGDAVAAVAVQTQARGGEGLAELGGVVAGQHLAGLRERGVGQGLVRGVEGEQPGHVDLPLVHLPPLGAPGHVGGQPLEERVGAAQPAGQVIDPGPGPEVGPPQAAEGAEPDLVALVEEGTLKALDCVHGSTLTPLTEHVLE